MNVLNNINLYLAAVDIDGTLKDLVKENTNALLNTMKRMNNIHLTIRGKFVLWINKCNMYFVKTGMLPTNIFMQNILLFVYSVLLLQNYSVFKSIYFEEYNNENIFFECAEGIIKKLDGRGLLVYLITKNKQNKRIMELKENYIIKNIRKLIIGRRKASKYSIYKSFFVTKFVFKEEILIVGDNFWDDVLPGLLLGVNVIWCNMYNSKFKKLVINILKFFFKNIKDDKELFITNKT